ncbi:hypothetical protein CC85DRAFT_286409 [Cutaneotrichosporon oleaginosum]|uniref:DUF2423 domain-containing protein n=1 Tax=Cutaneotrichosporon oleaginosum TaxID=879819 RepID=A0A0J0XK87_9TREE|nr:uncharacterized protein CC85DRAFT_286409 [Cutaneotrichosporon oleaginosum]KLT41500.1 hypothetical protein CC85DRAFT_286409 [Cutaneotrichosporon oleaginosum]TXT05851.1 hypothetical protein COLE_07171 [Cutaneotrichosporon oleaginosum]
MAKSLRSKTKLAARRRKAHMSHYAVADAERTARISERIMAKAAAKEDAEGDAEMEAEGDEEMKEEPKKISTSAPRGSRREEWRKSKGMEARPKLKGQNKLGRPISRHKAGKTKRRR